MDRIKAFIAGIPDLIERLRIRWPILGRIMGMLEWYDARRGNVYAAAISFIGMLSLVPILMVSFAAAGFVLASRPEMLADITDAVVRNMPGELGRQLNEIIESAIASRNTVGIVGLLSAALTGLGWMALVRNGLSEMWGGRMKRNAVLSKVFDLGMFVAMGALFIVTLALTAVAAGPFGSAILEFIGLDDTAWGQTALRVASTLVSILAMWLLFIVVLSKMPLQKVPVRVIAPAALVTAVVFEILKSLGTVYLQSVLRSPAGVAFGPILGVLVFAYLASRIVLYASAWSASNPANEDLLTVDEVENGDEEEQNKPVVLAPVYEVTSGSKARELVTAAGLGAAIATVASVVSRDRSK